VEEPAVNDGAPALEVAEPAKGNAEDELKNERAALDEPPPLALGDNKAGEEKGKADNDADGSNNEENGLTPAEKKPEGATMPPELLEAKAPEPAKGDAEDELKNEKAALDEPPPLALGEAMAAGLELGQHGAADGQENEEVVRVGEKRAEFEPKTALLPKPNELEPAKGDAEEELKNEKLPPPELGGNAAIVPNKGGDAANGGNANAGVKEAEAA
jgi:hypothetical protein